jgi:hypothetical protein
VPVYQLRETSSPDYDERTRQNVVDADATLIVSRNEELSGGTAFTKVLALQYRRPVLVIHEREGVSRGAVRLSEFLKRNRVRILNVAGPRESQSPGLGPFVVKLLDAALASTSSDNRGGLGRCQP